MPVIGGAAAVPRSFYMVPSPPVSGTVYQNTMGVNLLCSLTVTLSPTLLSTSTVKAELSTDGVTWVTYALLTLGGVTVSSVGQQVFTQIPNEWYYRYTGVNATLGAFVAVG